MSIGSYYDSALPVGVFRAKPKLRVAEKEIESRREVAAKISSGSQPAVGVWETIRWKHLNWNFLLGILSTLLVSAVSWVVAIHYILKIVK